MATPAALATNHLVSIFRSTPDGIADRAAAAAIQAEIAVPPIFADQIRAQNVAAELTERSAGARYPAVHIYCERIKNEQREKFRRFSGKIRMAIETRVSQDRMEGLEDRLHVYVEAVLSLLESSKGDWGAGMYYGGGYEVTFQPVRHGGNHFLQSAKVAIEVDASVG